MPNLIEATTSPYGLAAAIMLVLFAGLSDGVGTRAVGLLMNRITATAFMLSLLIAALLFLLSAAGWVWGIWLAAYYLFGVEGGLSSFFIAVSVSYGPLTLNALALLPLVGPLIRWVLRLWGFSIALGALSLLGLTLWQAGLCAAFGALLVSGTGWLLSEPAGFFGRLLWSRLTGQPRPLRRDDLPQVIPGFTPSREVSQ